MSNTPMEITGLDWETLESGDMSREMEDLTQMQRRFVWAMLFTGGRTPSAAAAMAGFASHNKSSLYVTAHRLTHDRRVLAAIQAEGKRRLQSGAIMAISTLLQIADGAYGAKPADRNKAIEMILGRAGMPQVTEHHVVNEALRSDVEIAQAIDEKLKLVGMKLSTLLGKEMLPAPVDAEYVEVDKGRAGLEDLL